MSAPAEICDTCGKTITDEDLETGSAIAVLGKSHCPACKAEAMKEISLEDLAKPSAPPRPPGATPRPADGPGKAGDQAGEHALEVELSLEELAQIMGEELQLPRIQPKGKQRIIAQKDKYVGIRRAGPESLRHFKRTFRQALRRQIMTGTYDPARPMIVPVREDRRYRSWRTTPMP